MEVYINKNFRLRMKIKSILVSQPAPNIESSPYAEIAKKEKVRFDFRSCNRSIKQYGNERF